ncbi:MAG TPA: tyrosine-type recombinase/integrase, partial [Polyangia bacterium]
TKAGIEDLRFHDTRHEFATRLRRRGVGLDVIQQLLGHADISTTRRYAHVEHKLMRSAIATQDEHDVDQTGGASATAMTDATATATTNATTITNASR